MAAAVINFGVIKPICSLTGVVRLAFLNPQRWWYLLSCPSLIAAIDPRPTSAEVDTTHRFNTKRRDESSLVRRVLAQEEANAKNNQYLMYASSRRRQTAS